MATKTFIFSDEEVETLKTALEEAQYYRFDEEDGVTENCYDCKRLVATTLNEDAVCDDHKEDKEKAAGYARLATIVEYQLKEMN